ncbi:MAG: DUF4198 domain-containing protein [Desulfobacterales bacterium]
MGKLLICSKMYILMGLLTMFLLLHGLVSYAHSHTFFIQSSRFHVHEGKSSPLFFCYGHHMPVDDGLRPEKLKSVRVYKPGGDIREIDIRNEICLHSYMVDYKEPGTYVLAAETTPGFYTVYIDKKGRERHTIKPKSAVADQAEEIKLSLYSKQYAKSYVTCEESSADFPGRIGQNLELIPVKDISELKPGDDLELKIYFKGAPYTGSGTWDATYNGFSTYAEDNFYPKTSVSGDTLRVSVPRPGRWFVRYSVKADASGADREKYLQEKQTATLVFEIPGKAEKAGK